MTAVNIISDCSGARERSDHSGRVVHQTPITAGSTLQSAEEATPSSAETAQTQEKLSLTESPKVIVAIFFVVAIVCTVLAKFFG